MQIYVEYVRGGGPRYVYNDNLSSKVLENTQATLVMNQTLLANYKDLVPFKRLRRMHLRIIAGIEMYYGNFKQLKMYYAAKELPELTEYILLAKKVSKMQLQDAHEMLSRGMGMQAVDNMLQEVAELAKKRDEILENIFKNKKEILDVYDISEDDIKKI